MLEGYYAETLVLEDRLFGNLTEEFYRREGKVKDQIRKAILESRKAVEMMLKEDA